MRWWLPPMAVTMRIALLLSALSVPCVTYEIEKSRMVSPLSSLKSPRASAWWGGSLGPCAKAEDADASNSAKTAAVKRMVCLSAGGGHAQPTENGDRTP